MTQFERMINGLSHHPGDPELSKIRAKIKDLLFELNYQTKPSEQQKRQQLLAEILPHCAEMPHINSPFRCDYGLNIHIGHNFFANFNCTMLDNGGIFIGDNVMLAPNVSFYTVGHPLDLELRNAGWEHAEPIRIEDNVWIGGNVVVLPGVTIGKNSVIGAGAVVTKDVPPNVLAFGNPCRVVREINANDRETYIQRYQVEDIEH